MPRFLKYSLLFLAGVTSALALQTRTSRRRELRKVAGHRLLLSGVSRLTPEEQGFLVLLGEYSNDLTVFERLLISSRPRAEDHMQLQCEGIVTVTLAKALASKVWLAVELIEGAFNGSRISNADWLRRNNALHEHLKALKKKLRSTGILEMLRNNYGCHLDLDAVTPDAVEHFQDQPFEAIYTDEVINSFYPSSAAVVWSGISRSSEGDDFTLWYQGFINHLGEAAGDLHIMLNLIMEAFYTHIVQDLGGDLSAEEKSLLTSTPSRDVRLPVLIGS